MVWRPTYGDFVDDAAERAGLDPGALTHRHLASFQRSMNLLLAEIEAEGARPEYRIETQIMPLMASQRGVLLPLDTIDVLDVSFRKDGRDRPLSRTTRQDWVALADKDTAGEPISYWVSKSIPTEPMLIDQPSGDGYGDGLFGAGTWGDGTASGVGDQSEQNVLVLWPVNSDGQAVLVLNRLRETVVPNQLGDSLDARRNWYETIVSGLAAKIAEKFAVEREPILHAKYREKLASRLQSEDRGPVRIAFRAHGHSRPRRH